MLSLDSCSRLTSPQDRHNGLCRFPAETESSGARVVRGTTSMVSKASRALLRVQQKCVPPRLHWPHSQAVHAHRKHLALVCASGLTHPAGHPPLFVPRREVNKFASEAAPAAKQQMTVHSPVSQEKAATLPANKHPAGDKVEQADDLPDEDTKHRGMIHPRLLNRSSGTPAWRCTGPLPVFITQLCGPLRLLHCDCCAHHTHCDHLSVL